jgi:membrane protein
VLAAGCHGQVTEVIVRSRISARAVAFLRIILAIWVASSGVRSTMNALNNAYNVAEARPMWRRYLMSICTHSAWR